MRPIAVAFSAIVFSVCLVFAGCKPASQGSEVKAVSNAEGTHAFAILPLRQFVSKEAGEKLAPKTYTQAALSQTLSLGLVVCKGSTAKIDVVLLEELVAIDPNALKRSGRKVLQNRDGELSEVKRCAIEGQYMAGPASVASMLLDSSSAARQAVYLGLRGSTTIKKQTASSSMYLYMSEVLGVKFPNLKSLSAISLEMDKLYNPCMSESYKFAKTSSMRCDASGSYISSDIEKTINDVKAFLTQTESAYVASLPKAHQKTYDSIFQLGASQPDLTSEIPAGFGSSLAARRASIVKKLKLEVETVPNLPQLSSTGLGFNVPDDNDSSWRKLKNGAYTRDGISFFEKVADGKYTRQILAFDNNHYVTSEKSGVTYFTPKSRAAAQLYTPSFSLTDGAAAVPPEKPIDPANTPWVQDQKPVLEKAIDQYRTGAISGEQLSQSISSVTEHMPYGRPSGNDPWTNTHNCVDISTAVNRSMYQVLPQSAAVGSVGVSSESTGMRHSVNFFAVPDGSGGMKNLAYDQQSGAISSKPYDTIDAAIADPQFQKTTNDAYAKRYGLPPPYAPDASTAVTPEFKVDYTKEQTRKLPAPGADGTYAKPVGYDVSTVMKPESQSVQYSENGQHRDVYTPSNPHYMWQQDSGLTGTPDKYPYKQQGYVKDGTHGTWGVPENATWYKPDVTYPASGSGQ